MPVKNLYPNGSTGPIYNSFLLGAGASKHQACQTQDGDTSYIYSNVAWAAQTLHMDDLDAEAVSQVNVRGYLRYDPGMGPTTGNIGVGLPGPALTWGTGWALTSSYALYSVIAIARPGGGSWSPGDVNNAQAGVAEWGGSTWAVRCTQLYLEVTYSPSAAGTIWLLEQWLLPLLPLASHGLLWREIAKILSNLRVRPSSEEDFRRILEVFHRRPRYA